MEFDLEETSLKEVNRDTLVDNMPEQVYVSLKRAIELGKWPNGDSLKKEQLAHCMQAVILYEHKHKEFKERTGYIDKGKKAGSSCDKPDLIPLVNKST